MQEPLIEEQVCLLFGYMKMKFLFHRCVEHGVNAFYATFVGTNCLCCYALKPLRFHLDISVEVLQSNKI